MRACALSEVGMTPSAYPDTGKDEKGAPRPLEDDGFVGRIKGCRLSA